MKRARIPRTEKKRSPRAKKRKDSSREEQAVLG
jgi:hypothetical protein